MGTQWDPWKHQVQGPLIVQIQKGQKQNWLIQRMLLSLLIYLLPATPFPLIWNLLELNLYSRRTADLMLATIDQLAFCPLFLRFLKKAIYKQLEMYLSSNNLIYSMQSGFRWSYSTDTCHIYLTDYIRSQMAAGKYRGMVLLDLQTKGIWYSRPWYTL